MQNFQRALFVSFVYTVVHVGASLAWGEPKPVASAINIFVNGICIAWATLNVWGAKE